MSEFGATLTELYEKIIRPAEDFLANNRVFVIVLIVLLLLYFLITLFRDDEHRNRFTVWVGIIGIALGFLYAEGLLYKMAAMEEAVDTQITEFADESATAVASLIQETDVLFKDGYILSEDDTQYAFTGDVDTPVGLFIVTQVNGAQLHGDPYLDAETIGEARLAQVLKCYGVDHNSFKNTTWYIVELESGEKGYLTDNSGRLFVKAELSEPAATEVPVAPEATTAP